MAIDEGWEASRKNPEAKAAWERYFPKGKPTVDEFMAGLENALKEELVKTGY